MANSVATAAQGSLPGDVAAAHHKVLAEKAIQFDLKGIPQQPPPPPPSGAGKAFGAFLDAMAPLVSVLFWATLALIVGAILYYIIREYSDFRFPWQKPKQEDEWQESDWAPDTAPARALLAEADALAAQGQYGEAAHLLLLRSVEDIARRKPNMLRPSSTAREISGAATLPDKARATFGLIARHVEASLFGGRTLDANGWTECREAYGRFALAGEWQ